MEWTIDYLEKDDIIQITTSGSGSWEQSMETCKEALALGRRMGSHRYLVDHRQLEHGMTILQVDTLPETFKEIGVTAEDNIAIVYDPVSELSDMFSFFRDSSFLASLRVRLFTEIDEASAWLKTREPEES